MPTYEYRCQQCGKGFERSELLPSIRSPIRSAPNAESTQVESVLTDFYAKTSKKR